MTWTYFKSCFESFLASRLLQNTISAKHTVQDPIHYSREVSKSLSPTTYLPLDEEDINRVYGFSPAFFSVLAVTFSKMVITTKLFAYLFEQDRADFLHFLLRCGVLSSSKRKVFEMSREVLFQAAAAQCDPTMLSCLFSPQLNMRSDPALQRRAIVELDVPLSSLDFILVADRHKYTVTMWSYRNMVSRRPAQETMRWLDSEIAKGNHKASFVKTHLRKNNAKEAEVVRRECMKFYGGAYRFPPLVMCPRRMLPTIAMDAREEKGMKRVVNRIVRRV